MASNTWDDARSMRITNLLYRLTRSRDCSTALDVIASGDVLGFLSRMENKPLPTLLKELMVQVGTKGQRHRGTEPNTENPVVMLNGNRFDRLTTGQKQSTDHQTQSAEQVGTEPNTENPVVMSNRLLKLFQTVVKFYQDIFEKDRKGRQYLCLLYTSPSPRD